MRLNVIIVATFLLLVAALRHPSTQLPGPRVGGTFIGAIIAEDGIVVGSDSRSTFLDTNRRHMGYVDGMQKIYVSKGAAVAISGLTSVEGELFPTFVARNSFLLDRSADEVLFGFSSWLPFENSTGVLLLSAGFIKGKATVCVRSVVQPQACRTNGVMANKPSPFLQTWISQQKAPPKGAAAAAALKSAILESAATDATVGGPITLVQLRLDSAPVWIENPPRDAGWKTICDLVRAYRAGLVRISPTTSKPDLDRFLGSTCTK